MAVDDWFLTTRERGNPFTRLDYRTGGQAWTSGNAASVLIHGVSYFARLRAAVEQQRAGDLLLFTDWRGDPDERLGDDELTIADLLGDAARRGVIVKGLCWRSHLDGLHYFEQQNRTLADDVRKAGGEVVLDQRVRPMGCHHQKFVVLRHPVRPELDVAFTGGIDLCHTRRDDAEHRGDPQTVEMGAVWGSTPAWHDLMIEVRGPAIGDIEATFRKRWEDPTSPSPDPISRTEALLHHDDEHPHPLPPQLPDPQPQGSHHVQVLRTYPAKHPRYPFAPSGRSWTHDSELTCAVLDDTLDGREPPTLRADQDPARRLPREARLALAREHLDRAEGDDADLVDPASLFAAFAESAARPAASVARDRHLLSSVTTSRTPIPWEPTRR
ncbi:hypothetical protein MM440_00605 [Arsenicicoccus piscis]|uniref:hypothetical protein n=1 Tax=Arsenicicoccus piscis TaxID=673954 RepID=UPI001F4CB11C|nr:hypothetical protein [Arsenicicoccus piscis]MCH8626326.1 hypothetical protein [Arsenicicoccus piscis]